MNVTGHLRRRGRVWHCAYRLPNGKQVGERIGPAWEGKGRPEAGYFTRKTAQARLDDILSDIRNGRRDQPGSSGVTFRQAASEYLRYVEDVKRIDRKTVADYRGVIEGYLLPEFGELPLEDVTPDLIDAYKERLIAKQRQSKRGSPSNRTIVRHLTVLHGIFKRAMRVYGLASNPASASLVERPRAVYTGDFDTLDGDEVELLASYADNPQDAAIYRAAAYLGLRQGELLGLRWGSVDFVEGLVHVRANYTGGVEKPYPKGKKVRSVPMVPEVVDALATLKGREHFTGDGDLVFCSTVGTHLDHYGLRRRFYAALDRAGLRRIRFHDLRHAFGSAAIKRLDPYAVQSYMGHAHYSTTQRYLNHKAKPEDAAKIAEGFGNGQDGVLPVSLPNQDISTVTQRNSEQLSVPEIPQKQAT
jgi:integrase